MRIEDSALSFGDNNLAATLRQKLGLASNQQLVQIVVGAIGADATARRDVTITKLDIDQLFTMPHAGKGLDQKAMMAKVRELFKGGGDIHILEERESPRGDRPGPKATHLTVSDEMQRQLAAGSNNHFVVVDAAGKTETVTSVLVERQIKPLTMDLFLSAIDDLALTALDEQPKAEAAAKEKSKIKPMRAEPLTGRAPATPRPTLSGPSKSGSKAERAEITREQTAEHIQKKHHQKERLQADRDNEASVKRREDERDETHTKQGRE